MPLENKRPLESPFTQSFFNIKDLLEYEECDLEYEAPEYVI